MSDNETSWTLLSNHAHVLVCLTTDSSMRLRDVATQVGITERAVQRIIMELETAKMISRKKEGRRNQYKIYANQPLRHPLERHYTVGKLLKAVTQRRGE